MSRHIPKEYILFTLLVAVGRLTAQPSTVTTSFTCVAWEAPIKEPLYFRQAGKLVPVSIHHLRATSPIRYQGPPVLEFLRKVETPDGSTYEPVGSVGLNPEWESPLFIFMKDSDNPGRYSIIGLENSFDKFSVGSIRFYNFTSLDLAGKVGEQMVTLAPHSFQAIGSSEVSGSMRVKFVVRLQDEVRPIYSSFWNYNPATRSLVFIKKSADRTRSPIEFKTLVDYPSPPARPL